MSEERWNELFTARHSRRALGGVAAGGLAAIGLAPLAEADPRQRRARRRKRRTQRPHGQKPPAKGQPPLGGAQQPTWEFAFEWGTRGGDPGELRYPNGVAVDTNFDTVYVVELGNDRIQTFTTAGEFMATWGGPGEGNGQFNGPTGIAVETLSSSQGPGNVYVADYYNSRVQKFTPDGDFLAAWGNPDDPNGPFEYPVDIAIDGDLNVYVTDYALIRVQKFTKDGDFITEFDAGGTLEGPVGIALGGDAQFGGLYVADQFNERIVEFDETGNVLRQWGDQGRGPGEFGAPYGVAVETNFGSESFVFVTDNEYDSVQVFDQRGAFLSEFGENGDKPGEFDSPAGIAVDDNGNLYVADYGNHRIQVFRQA